MSEVFQKMLQQALVREHAKLLTANAIMHIPHDGPAKQTNMLAVGRAAVGINEAAKTFDERLRLLVDRHRIRRPKIRLACPFCNAEHCPAAKLTMPLAMTSQAMMAYILSGGTPPEYET